MIKFWIRLGIRQCSISILHFYSILKIRLKWGNILLTYWKSYEDAYPRIKVCLRYKATTSQNVSSEAQAKECQIFKFLYFKPCHTLREKSPNTEFFLVGVFPYLDREYADLRSKSPYSVQIQKNTDQKNLRIWTLFTRWWFTKFCDVLISIITWDRVHFWLYLLNDNSLSHQSWPNNRYKQVQ